MSRRSVCKSIATKYPDQVLLVRIPILFVMNALPMAGN